MCLCSLVPTSHAPGSEHCDESCGGGGADSNHHCPHRGGPQVWGRMGLISGVHKSRSPLMMEWGRCPLGMECGIHISSVC